MKKISLPSTIDLARTRAALLEVTNDITAHPVKRWTAVGVLSVVGLTAVGLPLYATSVEAKEYVTVAAGHGVIDKQVEARGRVATGDMVTVRADAAGTVAWLGAGPGTRVRRGEVIARIAPPPPADEPAAQRPAGDERDARSKPQASPARQAASRPEAARKAVEEARARRDAARAEADKLVKIADLVPRLQIEAAQAAAKAASAAYDQAVAAARAAEEPAAKSAKAPSKTAPAAAKALQPVKPPSAAALRAAAAQTGAGAPSQREMTSPIDGVVVARPVVLGQSVAGGARANTLFTIAREGSKVQIRVPVGERQAAEIRPGMETTAEVSTAPGATFEGRVSAVDDGAVLVEIADAGPKLVPGLAADVSVSVGRREGVLAVPNAALRFAPELSERELREVREQVDAVGAPSAAVVWVQGADGELVARPVALGLSDGTLTEIASGLREGDLVVTGEVGAETAGPSPDGAVAPEPGDVLQAAAGGEGRGLTFDITPEVQRSLSFYTKGGGRLTAERALARSEGLRQRAEEIFREEGVPTELVGLAVVESAWQNTAVSPVGAAGIWQFMPATAERFGLTLSGPLDERYDFEKSTRAAATYLKVLSKRYDGNWALAIGAYNCGEGAMDEAIADAGGVRDFWVLSRNGLLPQETANYVPAVLAASLFVAEPAAFGLGS